MNRSVIINGVSDLKEKRSLIWGGDNKRNLIQYWEHRESHSKEVIFNQIPTGRAGKAKGRVGQRSLHRGNSGCENLEFERSG